MAANSFRYLSRREQQILDLVYRLDGATAIEVHRALQDAPSEATVRKLLRILEDKGHVGHEKQGREFVYAASIPREQASRAALRHVVETFFTGSSLRAASALVGSSAPLSAEEVAELEELIERAKRRERK